MRAQFDVVVSGGGIAGLAAAAAFGAKGYTVLCVDPSPPVVTEGDPTADLRTTAILQPSVDVLTEARLWDRFQAHATPLQVMRIVDAGGAQPEPRVSHDFNAADISEQPFGWNLPNWLLRRECVARLEELPNVTFRPGIGTRRLTTRERAAVIGLSDGSSVEARLLVAADGRNSPMRQALGIGVRTTRFGQKALAFAVTHPVPHENVSTEIHRSGGPFTFVPLPDRNGLPCSAIVWMETGPDATRLAALPVSEFEGEINRRSCGLFGQLSLVSRRTVWPIISQIADRFHGKRTALMAEAAHVVPPDRRAGAEHVTGGSDGVDRPHDTGKPGRCAPIGRLYTQTQAGRGAARDRGGAVEPGVHAGRTPFARRARCCAECAVFGSPRATHADATGDGYALSAEGRVDARPLTGITRGSHHRRKPWPLRARLPNRSGAHGKCAPDLLLPRRIPSPRKSRVSGRPHRDR